MPGTASLIEEAADLIEKAVNDLQPELLYPDDAARLVRLFSRAERLCASGATLASRKVEDSRVWAEEGHRSPADWLARETGTSYGKARATIETGRALADLPGTDQAFRSGKLSFEQAREVAEGAGADPSAEARLLEMTKTKTVRQLKEEVKRVKAAAEADQMGAYEARRRARFHRSWTDRMGMRRGEYALPPDVGAAFKSALDAEADRRFRRAHEEGRRDTREHYEADALVSLVTGKAKASGKGAEVVAIVSREALLRGRVETGEVSEILGAGPVPIEVVREILERDAFLTGVLVDGVDVVKVKRFGRHIPADVKTALTVRTFLEQGDVRCDFDGCDRTDVEWDHRHDHAKGGPTSYDNCDPLCRGHHRDKTAGRIKKVDGRWVVVGDEHGEPDGEERGPP